MAENQKFKGKVIYLSEPINIKDDLVKREFVVQEQEGQYPQKALFQKLGKGEKKEYVKDKFPAKEGDIVEVDYNITANYVEKYNRYFGNLDGWKITVISTGGNPSQNSSYRGVEDNKDDLPF